MRHVVALSGGKDSTAMALRLAEIEPREYLYVCTPTGDELPEMFAHWRRLGELLGKQILPITYHTGLKGLIREQKMLPNFRARFCTRLLKIEPYRAFLKRNTPLTSYVGLRADEMGRAGGAYQDIDGVVMRFPLREWGWDVGAVHAYLAVRGVNLPARTDCARCYHQRLSEWWALWQQHPALWADAEQDEAELNATFRSPRRDTWPVALKDLRIEFENGRLPRGIGDTDDLRDVGECRVCTL
jgi:hypothetical protein